MTRWVLAAGVGGAAVVLALGGCSAPAAAPRSASPSPPPPGPSASTTTSGATAPTASPVAASPTSTPSPTPSTSPSAAPVSTATVIRAIPADQWARIVATGTWRAGCPVARAGLRDVDVPYLGFDGRTHRGTLVVNADVAASVAAIFARLYRERYPIHAMVPIENYAGDDDASMAVDNTSGFNCRRPGQANAPSAASPHGNGRAIDVNPFENPWVDPRCSCFRPSTYYGAHRTPAAALSAAAGRALIVQGSIAWRVFTEAGWTWQDNSTPDYQHFDTGYPSRPLR